MDDKVERLIELCKILKEGAKVLIIQFQGKSESELTEKDKEFIARELIRLKFLIDYELKKYKDVLNK